MNDKTKRYRTPSGEIVKEVSVALTTQATRIMELEAEVARLNRRVEMTEEAMHSYRVMAELATSIKESIDNGGEVVDNDE